MAEVADNPDVVRVTLTLQDDVIDSYRVVIENDRQLSDARQDVPIPRVITGITEQRYATLQNAGRDEIEVLPSQDFQTLNRQLQQFARLKQKLSGGELTMAYVTTGGNNWPLLQFETKRRAVFDTVAASIEFAKTTMVVDTSGAYRALQNFQVNNRSEQYLEIELPAGARLLTVVVEGQPVKPVAWPAANNQQQLRIPLVKTSLGDLDYSVQLKYAGRLGDLSSFEEVEFPVIESLNINVQLSQLHLRLPETYRWMNFSGTMTRVDSRGELEASFMSYKSRQIQQLAKQIQSQSSSFGLYSKLRAFENLSKLEADMKKYESEWDSQAGSRQQSAQQLKSLIQGNNDAILRAQQEYNLDLVESAEVMVDNRANLNQLLEDQSARFARNSVIRDSRRGGGQNFFQNGRPQPYFHAENQAGINVQLDENQLQAQTAMPAQQGQPNDAGKDDFDGEWLKRNKLGTVVQEDQIRLPADSRGDQLMSQLVIRTGQTFDDSIGFINPNEKAQLVDKETEEALDAVAANDSWGRGRAGQSRDAILGGGGGFGGETTQERTRGDVTDGGQNRPGLFDSLVESNQAPNGPPVNLGDDVQSELAAVALTSLDIELPARGDDFYFKSPRGKAKVTVRPLETRFFTRWTSAMIIVAVCVGVWGSCWLVIWLRRFAAVRALATLFLLLAGLVSLVASVLPVYGLLAVAAAFVLIVDWITNAIWLRNAPTQLG